MEKQDYLEQDHLSDDEINLRKLLIDLWDAKIKIVAVTSIFAISSYFLSAFIQPEYRATSTLFPAVTYSDPGASIGQFSGLATRFGVNLGSSGGRDQSQIAYDIMQSWGFIDEFIEQNQLEVKLAAIEGWDRDLNQFIYNDSIYDAQQKKWLNKPSSYQLYLKFDNKMTVSRDQMTGVITLSLEHYSPIIAKELIELYVQYLNKYMASRKMNETNIYIEYLQNQISKTSLTGMQEVFYKVIEEQIKTKMLAEANPEYAFVTLSKAMIPEQRFKPRRSLIVIISALVGGILSILSVIFLSRTSD